MIKINEELTQQALDSLRIVRRKLYSLPAAELGAMSLDDQVKHADSLHKVALAILKLEGAKLKGINDEFQKKESELSAAATKLESDLAEINDAVKIIRLISDSISLLAGIIELL